MVGIETNLTISVLVELIVAVIDIIYNIGFFFPNWTFTSRQSFEAW